MKDPHLKEFLQDVFYIRQKEQRNKKRWLTKILDKFEQIAMFILQKEKRAEQTQNTSKQITCEFGGGDQS